MTPTFCTIITANYIHYALTLYRTLKEYNEVVILNILVADGEENFLHLEAEFPNIHFFLVKDICKTGIGKSIYDKYASDYMDEFRWSMKPVFIKYLIIEKNYNKIVCVDCDLGFFNNYQFIFDELDKYNILITPHWRNPNPFIDSKSFDLLFIDGLYNAGFMAVSKEGIDVMDWWANVCLYKCEKDFSNGQYVDQAYLNLMPIYFDKVKILKHKGCNVSEWNKEVCKRIEMPNGEVLIDSEWPVVFIHFTKWTISDILDGSDAALMPFLQKWYDIMKSHKKDFKIKILPKSVPKKNSFIQRIINRLK